MRDAARRNRVARYALRELLVRIPRELTGASSLQSMSRLSSGTVTDFSRVECCVAVTIP